MTDALTTCVERLGDLLIDHPTRVGIDGITAAGKTTFANHLAVEVARSGLPVIRVSMDGFHHRREVRHRQGRDSADGYYEDAYDFVALRRELLDPLGPDGDRLHRTAIIDLSTDEPIDETPIEAPSNAVLIVDGSFLQKPGIRDGFDLVVFLRCSFEAAAERGARRDSIQLGGIGAARAMFARRYHAAQRRYLAECDPERCADTVLDLEDPTQPRIIR